MTTARAFHPPSEEDIYANLDDGEAGNPVPSCRRITIPAMPRAKLLTREMQEAKTQPPANPPAYRSLSHEMNAVPDQSVRRLKASARVPGAPDKIEEPLTQAMLHDPRRESDD